MNSKKKRGLSIYRSIELLDYRCSLEVTCFWVILFLNGIDVVRVKANGAKIRIVTIKIEEGVNFEPSDVMENTASFFSYVPNVFNAIHVRIFSSGRRVDDEFVGVDVNVYRV